MTQTMDLNKMGLMPMSISELTEIEGGGFSIVDFIRDYVLGKLIDMTYEAFLRQVEWDKTHPNTIYNWDGSANWR
jgi:hypothetical protein